MFAATEYPIKLVTDNNLLMGNKNFFSVLADKNILLSKAAKPDYLHLT